MMVYLCAGASTVGDKVNRFLTALALALSLTPAAAQTALGTGQGTQPSAWGNLDWSQITAPPAAAPKRLAPPAAAPNARGPVSGAFRPPPAAGGTATTTAPSRNAPSVVAPEPRLAARSVPLPPRRGAPPPVASLEPDRPDGAPDRTDRTPPLAILLDGLGVYVEQDYVGVSALAPLLQRQGFRTVVDTHFMRKVKISTPQDAPAVIIGHSMGGQSALKLARRIVDAGLPAPLVLTIDAAPLPSACPVRTCINFYSPGFPRVTGAQNVDAWENGANLTNHAMLASHPALQRILLQYTASLLTDRSRRPVAQRSE